MQQMNALQAETQLEKVHDVIGRAARRRLCFAAPWSLQSFIIAKFTFIPNETIRVGVQVAMYKLYLKGTP